MLNILEETTGIIIDQKWGSNVKCRVSNIIDSLWPLRDATVGEFAVPGVLQHDQIKSAPDTFRTLVCTWHIGSGRYSNGCVCSCHRQRGIDIHISLSDSVH